MATAMHSSAAYATNETPMVLDNELNNESQMLIDLLGGANSMVTLPDIDLSLAPAASSTGVAEDLVAKDDDESDVESVSIVMERDKQVARRTHDLASLVMNYGSTLSDPYFASPVPMTDRSRYLMDYLFASRCHSVRTLLGFCWRWFHTDPGVYYHMLAASASCLTHKTSSSNKPALKQEALAYFNESITSVNSRLGNNASNGMISAVVAIALARLSTSTPHMSCWSSALWSKEREGIDPGMEWEVHLKGLKAMVDARGGVEALEDDRPLRYAIFALDTWGSTASNIRPRFPLPYDLVGDPSTLPRPAPDSLLTAQLETWTRAFPQRTQVCTVLTHLNAVLSYTNDRAKIRGFAGRTNPGGGTPLAPDNGFPDWDLFVREWLIPIINEAQRLLPLDQDQEPPQTQSVDHQMQDALRHATILAISAAVRRFGFTMKGIEVRVTSVKSLLLPTLSLWPALGLAPMLSWIMLTAGIECSANYPDEQAWFAAQLAARVVAETDGSYGAVEAAMLEQVGGFVSVEHVMASEGFVRLVDVVQAIVTKRAVPTYHPVAQPVPWSCHH